MRIFELLNKYKNKKRFNQSNDYTFFNKNKNLLIKYHLHEDLYNSNEPFDIISANIVIHGIKNKIALDKIIEEEYLFKSERQLINIKRNIQDKIIDLPYYNYLNYKIYIPFFNLNTNITYIEENEKMNEMPYINLINNYQTFLINCFYDYGGEIFNSFFTRLIKIREDATSIAFYHFDFDAIFIINKQGSLDNVIYLFDKYLKKVNKNHIIERIKPLIDAYYEGRINDFIYILYRNNLISFNLFRKICKANKI